MADSKTLSLDGLTAEVFKSREDADRLRHALELTDMPQSPLTLLAAAVAEYYDTCAAHGDLPASADAFAAQVSMMAKALALVEHKLMADVRASAESSPSTSNVSGFTDLPVGAFVVPGPVEPQ